MATTQIIANLETAFKQLRIENTDDMQKLELQSEALEDVLLSHFSPFSGSQKPAELPNIVALGNRLASKLQSIVMRIESNDGAQSGWIIEAVFSEGDYFFAATYLRDRGYYKDGIWHERPNEIKAREDLAKGQCDIQIGFDGEFFGKDQFYNKMMVGIES